MSIDRPYVVAMQDLERRRFDEACEHFEQVFREAYEAAKAELAAGTARANSNDQDVLKWVGISAPSVKDGAYHVYRSQFTRAAREAALVESRYEDSFLQHPDPESGERLFLLDEYRWVVHVNGAGARAQAGARVLR
jgi:hypothetical protein